MLRGSVPFCGLFVRESAPHEFALVLVNLYTINKLKKNLFYNLICMLEKFSLVRRE